MVKRFVAVGDSFTEGVGDPDPLRPNGVRGWADRVAEALSWDSNASWEYANLSVRGKRLEQIVADQIGAACAMNPTVITMYAGGNDLMNPRLNLPALMAEYERAVRRLVATGGVVVLFTGYDVRLHPALNLLHGRNHAYNEAVRDIASRLGCLLVDHWAFEDYQHAALWDEDRLHMSAVGHQYMAMKVLEVLGASFAATMPVREFERVQVPGLPSPDASSAGVDWLWQLLRKEVRWFTEYARPWLGRRLRRVSLGDSLCARYPRPVPTETLNGVQKAERRAPRELRESVS